MLAFNGLVQAVNNGLVEVKINVRHFHKPKSPAYNPWVFIAPVMCAGLVTVSMMIWCSLVAGSVAGATLLVMTAVAYKHYYIPRINAEMKHRIRRMMLASVDKFEEIWAWGGVKLIMAGRSQIGVKAGDDWCAFIALNFPDLMRAETGLPAAPGLPDVAALTATAGLNR
jgi:hypothetical protein